MNRIIKTMICVAFVATGCQKEFLEPRPLSIFTPENVFVDKAGMDAVLLTLRRTMRFEFYGGRVALLGEYYSSDLGVSADIDVNTISNWNINVRPTGTGVQDLFVYWRNGYTAIRNANVVISRINTPKWNSERDKNEILAEGYFHRAYWYYRLIHQFGDVPFLNREYTAPKIDFFTHSRKTILKKLQEDLEFSVEWLPEVVDPGKVNRAAGYHLLTKIYLANSEFDKAIAAASAVIDDNRYALMTSRFGTVANNNLYNVVWDLHQAPNKSMAANREKILVVQDKFGFGAASTDGTQSMRNWTPWWSRNIHIRDPDGRPGCTDMPGEPQVIFLGRGVGYFRTSNYFTYNLWIGGGPDLRHDDQINWFNTKKLKYNNPASRFYNEIVDIRFTNPRDTFRAYFDWPYYKLYVKDDVVPMQPRGGNSDWYIFRLAETYLLRAEAYVWKGNMVAASGDVNKVRVRARAIPATPQQMSIEYILDERARELYVEEPRKCELTRIALIMAENNLRGYSMTNFHQKNYWHDRLVQYNFYNRGANIWGPYIFTVEPFHVFWPIPQDEIDSNPGGRINQNLGYPGAEQNIPPKTEITEDD